MHSVRYIGDRIVESAPADPVAPGPDEVQIRVAYVGLCGTDLHIVHGSMDARVTRPLVFGHEMSGTVEAVGSNVTDWQIGDPVSVMPLDWDDTCPACRAGHTHICHNLRFLGIDTPGALQELWTVPARAVVALPPELDLRSAALVEPVAVAVHDVRRGGVREGDHVVVIGGGPIGALIAIVARNGGATVLVIEPDAPRREAIAAEGFATLDPTTTDGEDFVTAWTSGSGADVVFEVSGAAAAVLGSVRLAKVRGHVVIVAIHGVPREMDLQRVFWRELTLHGARVYEAADVAEAVRLLAAGVIPTDSLITAVVPLAETANAIGRLESGRDMKVLVDVRNHA